MMNGSSWEKMSDSDIKTYLDLWRKKTERYYDCEKTIGDRRLSDNQKKQLHEVEISLTSILPFVNPGMYNALDLTKKQQHALEGIIKKLEPEYEKIVDDFLASAQAFLGEEVEEMMKMNIRSKKEYDEIYYSSEKKLFKQKSIQEVFKRGYRFVDQLELEISAILTDVQKQKMENLINNPSDIVKEYIDSFKKEYGALAELRREKPIVAHEDSSTLNPQVSDDVSGESPESEQVDDQESD